MRVGRAVWLTVVFVVFAAAAAGAIAALAVVEMRAEDRVRLQRP
jgi:hypothetical protein